MAEEANRFITVGYLVPSRTGKSLKVIVDGRVLGQIPRGTLLKALRAYPMQTVAISRFVSVPVAKATTQATLKIADPEKLRIEEPQP